MDPTTSNFITTLLSGFFGFFSNIYSSAKERKCNMNCCGCVIDSDVVMKDDKK